MTTRKPRTPHPRLAGQARVDLAADLAERYAAGESTRGLAADIGRSYGLTRALLLEAGATLRPWGGRREQDGERG